jgi:hypothetical protein
MNNQPEALRLADLWEKHSHGYARTPESRTAAELRRLHQEHEEDQCVIAVWRGRTQQAEAQRDALLEALKLADQFITNGMELGFIRMPDAATPDLAHETPGIARAAIAAVEEGK